MTGAQKVLLKGALKSAVAAATGVITGLPAIDSDHFNITTWQGILRLLGMILWVTVVAEARFWNQWAHSGNGTAT